MRAWARRTIVCPRVLDQGGRIGVAVAEQRAHGVELVARRLARGIELQRRGEGLQRRTEVTALELRVSALEVVACERGALCLLALVALRIGVEAGRLLRFGSGLAGGQGDDLFAASRGLRIRVGLESGALGCFAGFEWQEQGTPPGAGGASSSTACFEGLA